MCIYIYIYIHIHTYTDRYILFCSRCTMPAWDAVMLVLLLQYFSCYTCPAWDAVMLALLGVLFLLGIPVRGPPSQLKFPEKQSSSCLWPFCIFQRISFEKEYLHAPEVDLQLETHI